MREKSFVEQLTRTKKTKETRETTAEEHYTVWSEETEESKEQRLEEVLEVESNNRIRIYPRLSFPSLPFGWLICLFEFGPNTGVVDRSIRRNLELQDLW